MITEVIMPKNGMDMTEGVLVRWLKNEGEKVEYEEPLFVVETDKITMESESPASGILLKKLYPDGTTAPVFTVLGYIGEAGDNIPEKNAEVAFIPQNTQKSEPQPERQQAHGEKVKASPKARMLAKERGVELNAVSPSGADGEITERDVKDSLASATPLARAMIADTGERPAGSGFNGKIQKRDFAHISAPAETPADIDADDVAYIELDPMRRTIARRMEESCRSIPSVTQDVCVDVTELLALREKINAGRDKNERITINDLVLKAVALALVQNERFRMTYDGQHYVLHSAIDVGMAVGIDGGLVVPVIRHANRLSLSALSAQAKRLTAKAKENSLLPGDMGDARISVTNLGMYGVHSFTPVINPPEASIVGVSSVEDKLVLDGDKIAVRKVMMLSVTFDHRIVNGTEVCKFSNDVKRFLENPYSMLI